MVKDPTAKFASESASKETEYIVGILRTPVSVGI